MLARTPSNHRNCALKVLLIRTPMPLEEAAERFDRAFRVLLDAPPGDISTPDGPAHVVDRHACAYGGRRFGHVIMEYRGRVVSLLMTPNEEAGAAREPGDELPHLIGRPKDGLSGVSVDGSRHAILLVSDLGTDELTQLSKRVSGPLAQRMDGRLSWSIATRCGHCCGCPNHSDRCCLLDSPKQTRCRPAPVNRA
jgi:hypothetical protein